MLLEDALRNIRNMFTDKVNRIVRKNKLTDNQLEIFNECENIIIKETSNLDNSFTLKRRILFIEQGLSSIICDRESCGNNKYFNISKQKFSIFCRDCLHNHKEEFYQKRSGKIKKAMLLKYGVDNVFKLKHYQDKAKTSMLIKYGVDNCMKYPNIVKKAQTTYSQKYGYNNAMQNPIHRKKFTDSMLKRYGVKHALQNKTIYSKVIKTNLKKYGVKNYTQSELYVKNMMQQNLEIHGVEYVTQAHYNINNFKKLSSSYISDNFLNKDHKFKLDSFKAFLNCNQSTAHKLLKKFKVNYNHSNGGFNPDKEATLYYIKDKETNLYKIGITNNSLYDRFGKAFLESRAEILMEETYENGQDAYLAEQEILQAFKPYRCNNDTWPEAKGGKTEFFNRNILEL